MRKEYFDEVDENNEPTGRVVSRGEAHKQDLWHRTAHAFFYRKSAEGLEFLVHKRARLKTIGAGKWDARFGGHLHAGESIEQGVVHEVAEEVGLHLRQSELQPGEMIKRPKPGNNEFQYVFYYQFTDNEQQLNLDPEEVEEIKWMSEDEIKQEIREHPEQWAGSLEIFNNITGYLKEHYL